MFLELFRLAMSKLWERLDYHNLTVSLAQIAVDAAARAVIERDSIFTDFFVPHGTSSQCLHFSADGRFAVSQANVLRGSIDETNPISYLFRGSVAGM